MTPTVFIVGADKGGVGKTTVSRLLLDYFFANGIGECGLRSRIAVGNRRLRTFFDIEYDHQRQPRAIRPARIGRRPAVADEVAIVIGPHVSSDFTGSTFPIFSARSSSN